MVKFHFINPFMAQRGAEARRPGVLISPELDGVASSRLLETLRLHVPKEFEFVACCINVASDFL
jgi:hypothetical protein